MDTIYQNISSDAKKVWRINTCIIYITCLFFIFIGLLIRNYYSFILAHSLLVFIVSFLIIFSFFFELFILIPLRQKYWKYVIRDNFIELRKGRYFFKRTIIPISQICYINRKDGP